MANLLYIGVVLVSSFVLFNCEVYSDRPKIKVSDGDLIFEAAYDKSIYLKSNGPKSTIYFGDVDYKNLSNATRSSLNNLPFSNDKTQNYPTQSEDLLRRIERLESLTATLTYNFNLNVTRLTRRVNLLNTRVSNLLRNKRKNECQSDPCANGGTCLNLVGGYHCLCPTNWKGTNCDEDVNECHNFAGTDLGCQNGATCINTQGSYRCVCQPGWYGVDCTRTAKNCSLGDFEMCGHGTCIPVESGQGIKCFCNQGWTTNGNDVACLTDVNECESGQGARCSVNPRVECINLPGSFRCGACPQGYTGDGFACYDIDECLTIPNGGCSTSPMVSCHNTIGSRICGSCPTGYQGDGITCTWRGSCSFNRGGCHPSAQCIDNTALGGVTQCVCPFGTEGDGIGLQGCYVTAYDNTTQRCENNPCGAHGHCHPLRNGYTCICHQGYSGAHCDKEVNACSNNPCHNGGTCRLNDRLAKGFRCECTALYSGDMCQIHSQPCGGVLDSEEGSIIYPISNTTYSHNSRCAWVIHTAPEKVINVTFTKFNLEYNSDCRYDFVQIHDGRSSASQLIGRFCGNTFPKGGNIISSHNNLYFWFRSDQSVAKEGFSLHWTSISPVCGGEVNATTHGHIRSPGSPGNYPPNRDCYWHLSTTLGKRLQLHFFELDIEEHANCSFDFLSIYDGSRTIDPLISKYCNSTQPAPIQSAGSDMLIHFHSDGSGTGKGFQITYAPIEGVPGCGGFFTNDKGEIISPSYNGAYLNNLFCEYKIKTSSGTRIRIEFKSFNLERSFRCRYDYLKIYDGLSEDSRLVGKFCGKNNPKSYTSSSNSLFIIFKSDHSTAAEGFKISYESVCLKTITGDSGIIKTPGYPLNYQKHMVCDYVINSAPGKAIVLTFQDFDIEDNRYYNCQYDHVEIRDGPSINSTLMGRYCGSSEFTPPTQTSSHNYMFIRFKSDVSITGRGFYANYTTINTECGGIYKENTGIINHPIDENTPTYSNGQSCTWMLVASEGMHIKLTWNRFELENLPSCNSDYVVINEIDENNDNNTLGKYCGNTLPPALTTSSNRLMIKFVSDDSVRYKGFSLSYTFLDEKTHCGGLYVKTHGYVYSPGWPSNYESNRDCTWTITVPAGQQIMLNITDFDLERPLRNSCEMGDYLTIRDGSSENAALIGTFCGFLKSKRIITTGNSAYLKFHSDFYLGGKGFKIEWDGTIRGCGGVLSGAFGSISSPNYPQNYNENAECFYRIVTSSGSKIRIKFIEIDLEHTKDCKDDYVEIFDGRDSNALSFGKRCFMPSQSDVIETSSNYAFIKFRSDIFVSAKGFLLNYNTICNNNITGSYGVIESPGFPDNYPSNINCLWTINVPKGNKINITFTKFDIFHPFGRYRGWSPYRPSYLMQRNCETAYLQYKETLDENFSNKICGTTTPHTISTISNSFQIKFVSGNYFSSSGFRLEWISYGCGGHIKKRFGTLSMDQNVRFNSGIECEWIIETPIGTAVSITFSEIYMTESQNCSIDSIELYNGQNKAFPLMTKICHRESISTTIRASSNFLLVRLVKQSSLRNVYFNARFDASKEGCGGEIYAPSGLIQSKNYPRNYENNLDCIWLITVPKFHRIELNFISFDLYSTDNDDCGDSIKIYDNLDFNSNYTSLICPKTNKTQVLSEHSSIKVQFQTNAFGNAKGFKANFTMTCGAVIKAKSDGIISSTQFINYNHRNCIWVILAPNPNEKVRLTIQHISLSKNADFISNRNCPASYLRVLDGNNVTSPLIDEFCGHKAPPTIITRGSALTIVLGSYTGSINGYFSAHYSVLSNACGGKLSSEEGSIATPNYPFSYPNNANCEWTLSTSPGNRVYITFEDFDLNYSENCNEDYLEIRKNDGGGELLAVYCGQEVPFNTTIGTKLYIKFHSDDRDTGKGFLLHYGFLHGNEITGLNSGEIASPLYPFSYEGRGEYSWRVITQGSAIINIHIDQLEIHTSSEVCSSKLLIYDGYDDEAPIIKELCGLLKNKIQIVQTTSNVFYLKLILDETNFGSKFHIQWAKSDKEITEKGNNINCGLNQTQIVSPEKPFVFNSPNYPNDYNPDLTCVWIFDVNPGRHLSLTFKELSIENTPSCFADHVSIFSLNQGNWAPIAEKICLSETVFKKTYTSITAMKVTFKSDPSITKKGFQATVWSNCGGLLQDKSGVIEINAFDLRESFDSKIRCNWTVKVRPGRTIQMKFMHFNISNNNDCTTYVILRNGESMESPLLGDGKYCGYPHEHRDIIVSSSNAVYISYVTTNVIETNKVFQNFKLFYEEKNIECGLSSSLDADHKWEIITSPNYPSVPIPYTECIWTFTGPPGEILRIDFLERFDLETSEQCTLEFVEVRDGSSQIAPLKETICRERPSTIKTSSNAIFIKYATQIAEPRNGFKANVSIDLCGGTIVAKSGEVLSPGYPHLYTLSPGTVCEWHIISLAKHVIQLNFKDFDLPESEKPCETKITIEELIFVNNTSQVAKIKEFCDNTSPDVYTAPIQTFTNKVTVKLQFGQPSQWTQVSERRGFRFTFISSIASCGDQITSSEGYLTTPGYPRETALRYCHWAITVPDVTRRIRLELLDFDVNLDLGVFNDLQFTTLAEEQLNHNSSSNNLKIFESTGNKMSLYIFMSKKRKLTHRFKARFTSDEPALCGGNLQGIQGEFRSPDLTSEYSCEWNYNGESVSITNEIDTNNTYKTLSLNVTINTRQQKICRYMDSKLVISSNLMNKGVSFHRSICGNNTKETYNIPAPNMLVKAIQYKHTPLSFDLSWKLNPCGGLVYAKEDAVNILNVPNPHNMTIDCVWYVVAPEGVRSEFKLEGSFNLDCSDEFVQINQGIAKNSPQIGHYCKTQSQEQALAASYVYTSIYYHSKPQTSTNVKLMMKTTSIQCGGYLSKYLKRFHSPNYPTNYPDNQECIWLIGAEVGYRISLQFEGRFAIEDKSNCTKDAIIVYDWKENKYEEIARLCGRRIPPSINSTSNQMKVVFRSDEATNLDGFNAKWVPICGGTLKPTREEQYLYSPGYTNTYYPSLNCEYNIQASSEMILIKFLDFELEGPYPECEYDNLTVTAQSTYNYFYGVYCGKELPPPVHANDKIQIIFKSDRYGERKGFKLSYSLYTCGGTIKTPTVLTAGKLDDYIENTNCTWYIESPPNKVIIFKFWYIDLESSYDCYNDYIAVYDGSLIDSNKRLSLMCGHVNTSTVLKSTNNTAILQFVSDSNLNYKGFKVEVFFSYSESVGCGGHIDLTAAPSKTLKSPLIGNNVVYENYLDCHWTIEAPSDHYIKIQFTAFHIASCLNVNQTALGRSNCDCDFVELKDGLNPNSLIMGKYCGHTFPPQLSSSSNTMTVRLTTDGEETSSGFEALLTTHPSQCGPSSFKISNTLQTLKSPGYETGVIPRGLHCSYFFDASLEPYSTVHIKIKDLDLESGTENLCNNDRLIITSFSQPRNMTVGKDFILNESSDDFFSRSTYSFDSTLRSPKRFELCGIKKSIDYYVSGSIKMNLQTSAETTHTHKGVEISVSYVDICGRNHTELQGRIQSQTISYTETGNKDCYTLISVPENYTISMYFLSLTPVYWNDQAFLKIYDGNTTASPLIIKVAKEYQENVQIFSNGRYLLLHNHIVGSEAVTYDMNYVATNKSRGCGGFLHNGAGRVTSPLYPDVYRKKSTCEWELETPIGTRIMLHFLVFDLGRICDQNYLSLVDRRGNDISTYCAEIPADYTSEDNYVKIVFTTTRNNGGTGWVADFIAVA